ncbi:MAG: hypothetical protein JWL86_5014, partial [Rhizobium sp.]|nr:hypothetical protein [Rhizobium sp.]
DIRLSNFTDAKRSAEAIRAAYQSLLGDPTLRGRLMSETEAYSWSGAAASYFALYDGILQGVPR